MAAVLIYVSLRQTDLISCKCLILQMKFLERAARHDIAEVAFHRAPSIGTAAQ